MRLFRFIRRFAAFAVATHLALLPAVAAIHEASHYRFEAGVALDEGVAPCPDAGAARHHSHLDVLRPDSSDLLCAAYHAFQKTLERQDPSALEFPKSGPLLAAFPDTRRLISRSTPLPQSRSPPFSA